jgi:hypothetical protein
MWMIEKFFVLVVVDSNLLFDGGGETDSCLASAIRFDERLELMIPNDFKYHVKRNVDQEVNWDTAFDLDLVHSIRTRMFSTG